MGQRVSKLPAKLLDRSIANALNRVSAFDERNQILEAEIYDDLLPARSHVLLRFLRELIERADEELPRGVRAERSSQHEQDHVRHCQNRMSSSPASSSRRRWNSGDGSPSQISAITAGPNSAWAISKRRLGAPAQDQCESSAKRG